MGKACVHWVALALLGSCSLDERRVGTPTAESCADPSCALDASAILPTPSASMGGTPSGPGTSESTSGVYGPGTSETTSGVSSLADGAACLSVSRAMDLQPSALYFVLDSSSSMLEATGSGASKWVDVQTALRGFLAETRESDLLVGLQFFPLLVPGSKFVCTSQADCGPRGGPCFLSTCLQGSVITPCATDADCGSMPETNPCVPFGLCSGDMDLVSPTACVLPSTCPNGLGTCVDFERTCTNAIDCDPAAPARHRN